MGNQTPLYNTLPGWENVLLDEIDIWYETSHNVQMRHYIKGNKVHFHPVTMGAYRYLKDDLSDISHSGVALILDHDDPLVSYIILRFNSIDASDKP